MGVSVLVVSFLCVTSLSCNRDVSRSVLDVREAFYSAGSSLSCRDSMLDILGVLL